MTSRRALVLATLLPFAAIALGSSFAASASRADASTLPPLIPRSVLFGNPDKAAAQISPDGSRIGYLAPVNGVLNVWVAPVEDLGKAKPVTGDSKRGIRIFFWAYTSRHILYLQDTAGDENWRVYSVDLASGETKDLTPLQGVAAQITAVSPKFPEEIVVGLNDRNAQLHDLHRVNIRTGERTKLLENEGFAGYLTDDDYKVRFAFRVTPDGGSETLKRKDDGSGWDSFVKVPMSDTLTTSPAGLDKTGKVLYMTDSRGRNTSALTAIDIATGQQKVLAEDARADVSDVMAHPTEKRIQAVAFTYDRKSWKILDPSIQKDLDALRKVADGEIQVTSRTLDDSRWTVAFIVDDGPVRTYLYDRTSGKARFLFTNRTALEGRKLAKMRPAVIKARDGLSLVSYVSLPPASDPDGDGVPSSPLPMVLAVHGGPWARDDWGYNPWHQWLANRGYAVLSVNFRGSTGMGKSFTNAGDKQWGAKMHEDLQDAVEWAVGRKIADRKRVAIFGGSYGGYATLVGMTFTPDYFTCGVDLFGPSNLETLLNTIPPYWMPILDLFTTRVGDHRTDEGRAFLKTRSPLTYVDRIKRPLLIGQGANDARVKQSESDQIVSAMQAKKIPVTYVLYSDEGHGFARPENNTSFNAIVEAFLAKHLGGRFEPVGKDFSGAAVEVKTGADQIPGLPEALEALKAMKPAPSAAPRS